MTIKAFVVHILFMLGKCPFAGGGGLMGILPAHWPAKASWRDGNILSQGSNAFIFHSVSFSLCCCGFVVSSKHIPEHEFLVRRAGCHHDVVMGRWRGIFPGNGTAAEPLFLQRQLFQADIGNRGCIWQGIVPGDDCRCTPLVPLATNPFPGSWK